MHRTRGTGGIRSGRRYASKRPSRELPSLRQSFWRLALGRPWSALDGGASSAPTPKIGTSRGTLPRAGGGRLAKSAERRPEAVPEGMAFQWTPSRPGRTPDQSSHLSFSRPALVARATPGLGRSVAVPVDLTRAGDRPPFLGDGWVARYPVRGLLDLERLSFLSDHRVFGRVILPDDGRARDRWLPPCTVLGSRGRRSGLPVRGCRDDSSGPADLGAARAGPERSPHRVSPGKHCHRRR